MSIKTVYVQGTKKAANEALAKGERTPTAIEYKPGAFQVYTLRDLAHGDVIKFWIKEDPSGTPIAKSYGNWNARKARIS
jgi:hypothetical protein